MLLAYYKYNNNKRQLFLVEYKFTILLSGLLIYRLGFGLIYRNSYNLLNSYKCLIKNFSFYVRP